MSRATIELDFLGLQKEPSPSTASKSPLNKFLDRRSSFKDIQSAISKIDPEVLKSVIASGSAIPKKSFTMPYVQKGDLNLRPPAEISAGSAPFTIFYNGVVSVFDIPVEKAESILKVASEGSSKSVKTEEKNRVIVPSSNEQGLLKSVVGDMPPIARRKSLQIFLQKRKERLSSGSPYESCHT